jgi:hypothetical protein
VTEDRVVKMKCAACGKLLAMFITRNGQLKHCELPCGDYRHLTVFRVVALVPVEHGDDAWNNYAPWDDFRPRYLRRSIGASFVTVTEMPYTCDADACEDAVRSSGEWTQHASIAKRYVLVPGTARDVPFLN